jgi:colicin import membrane protein
MESVQRMQMKACGVVVLAGCLAGLGCSSPQIADPAPVFASQADLASIRQAISPCLKRSWAPPGKSRSARVVVRWRLDEDGRLVGDPEMVDPERIPPDSPVGQSAIKAVRACEPFRLPMDKYDLWKEIVFTFDAASM